MYETMIGKYTDKLSDLGDVRKLLSWVELYSLKENKRSITWANLKCGENLKCWVFSPNSGLYFQVDEIRDNGILRRWISRGNVFMAFDATHDYEVKETMRIVGQKYDVKDIDYERHYIPLMEKILDLENQENLPKGQTSVATVQQLKREISEILSR